MRVVRNVREDEPITVHFRQEEFDEMFDMLCMTTKKYKPGLQDLIMNVLYGFVSFR